MKLIFGKLFATLLLSLMVAVFATELSAQNAKPEPSLYISLKAFYDYWHSEVKDPKLVTPADFDQFIQSVTEDSKTVDIFVLTEQLPRSGDVRARQFLYDYFLGPMPHGFLPPALRSVADQKLALIENGKISGLDNLKLFCNWVKGIDGATRKIIAKKVFHISASQLINRIYYIVNGLAATVIAGKFFDESFNHHRISELISHHTAVDITVGGLAAFAALQVVLRTFFTGRFKSRDLEIEDIESEPAEDIRKISDRLKNAVTIPDVNKRSYFIENGYLPRPENVCVIELSELGANSNPK